MITFSALPRLRHCTGSEVSPATPSDNDDSSAGTARHLYLEAVGNGIAPADALLFVREEHRAMCASIELDGLPLTGYRHEVPMALDVTTGQGMEIVVPGPRQYPALPGHVIPGTLDTVGPEVWDYKGAHDTTCEPAPTNLQLHAQMLAAGVFTGGLIHLHEDGSHWKSRVTLDAASQQSALDSIAGIVAAVQHAKRRGGLPIVSEGDWCRYCPAKNHCPAKAARMDALAPTDAAIHPELSRIMRQIQENPRGVREWVKHASSLVQQVAGQLRVAHPDGFAVGDGQWYGPRPTSRETIDGRAAFDAIQAAWGVDAALAAVSVEATKGGVEEAARMAKAAGLAKTVKGAKDDMLARLRDAGAVSVKASVTWDEHQR